MKRVRREAGKLKRIGTMAQKKQILIVDDNALNRSVLKAILCDQYRIVEAENGQEALNILRQYNKDIALILMDVIMPVMDGYTFLDRIRKLPEPIMIPVIVTTQSDSERDRAAALSHGAADFVAKPYCSRIILQKVAGIIESDPFDRSENKNIMGEKEMTVQELYDLIGNYEEVKSRLMSDRIVAKFIVKFLNDPSYEQLMQAWDQKNSEMIFKASHTLKGVCANLALSELYETANRIAEAYRPGQEQTQFRENMPDLMAALQSQYEKTVQAIQQFASENGTVQ